MSKWQCSRCWKKYTTEELMKLEMCYVRPETEESKRNYGKTSICTCGAVFHKDVWQLLSFIEKFRISTVHMVLGHSNNADFLDMDYDYYFETMIFDDTTGRATGFQVRYKTQEDAERGHWNTVDLLPRIIENPQNYPSSIITTFCNMLQQADYIKDKLSEEVKKRSA